MLAIILGMADVFLVETSHQQRVAQPAAPAPVIIVLPPQPGPIQTGFPTNEVRFTIDLNSLPVPSSTPSSSTSAPPRAMPSTPPVTPASSPAGFLRGASSVLSAAADFFGNSARAQTTAPPTSGLPTADNPAVAQVFDPENHITNLQPTFVFAGSDIHIVLPKPGRNFAPGAYHLKLWVWHNGVVYYSENVFRWGVLAVNFNKSIYAVGDTAKIGFAVLTDQGHTVCNATIDANITSPSGHRSHFSTTDNTISRSPTCGPNTVTNRPDYTAAFSPNEAGTYNVSITAVTDSGKKTIADSFEAQNPPLFDVERLAPTRIYPPATYQVTIKVKANADYAGQVIETVPNAFSVVTTDFSARSFNGDTQTLSLQVDIKKGGEKDLVYSFKAPNISPELYKLGPLQIGSWREARQWQIAADAVAFRSAGTVVIPAPGAANITLTAPAGVAATDIVLAVIYESTAGSGLTITPPAGWTLAVSTSDITKNQSVYWALGNVASYVFGMAGNLDTIGFTLAYTGVDNTTPMDATAVGQINAASVTITAPSITTVTANDMLVGFFGITTQSTFTSALTIRQQGNGPVQDTNPVGLAAADVAQAIAGASGAETATASVSGGNLGQLLALRPAVAGALSVSKVVLNGGTSIVLTPNATTTISAVASTTAGANPISYATSTIYRSGVGATCAANNLNCYQLASSSCSFSGATTTVTCSAGVWYFAQATDASSSFSGQNWLAAITITDSASATNSSTTASGVALNTLLAINVTTSSVNYGTVLPGNNTGSTDQTTVVQNAGNASTTLNLSGTALTLGVKSIATSSQHYATSSFTFGGAEQILNDVATAVSGFLLTAPTSTTNVSSPIFWGITVPTGMATGTYSGTNTFTAIFSP